VPVTARPRSRPVPGGGPPPPAAKRRKGPAAAHGSRSPAASFAAAPHPLGIQPGGNALFTNVRPSRNPGLGALRLLPDELLVDLLGWLDPRSLVACAPASHALYAFTSQEDLWKALALEGMTAPFRFGASWRETYLRRLIAGGTKAGRGHPRVRVRGLFSDFLFQPWLCAVGALRPEWLRVENVDRRSNLSAEDFVELFDGPGRPVVITDAVPKWPAFKRWTREYLLAACGATRFRCGPLDLTLSEYFEYMDRMVEERPLYLFDCKFADKVPQLGADYAPPPQCREDFFALLGDRRPDWRWLVMGKARSGSSFHFDPNATSAWNGLVTGAKRWILLPPHCPPPGVFASADMGEVAAPQSLYEWFMNFHHFIAANNLEAVQCTVRAGELLYVPRGWWHAVINLEESTAITQNFVNRQNLPAVLAFLRDKPDQVSGVPDDRMASLYGDLRSALQQHDPAALADAEAAQGFLPLAASAPSTHKPSPWAAAAALTEEFAL